MKKKLGAKAEEINRQLQATGKPYMMLIEDGKDGFYFDWKLNHAGTAYVFAGLAIKNFLDMAAENGMLEEAKRDLKKIIEAQGLKLADDGLNDLKKAFGVI